MKRHKPILLPKINKTVYKQSAFISAISSFNTLVNELKSINGNKKFVKKSLKRNMFPQNV